ncbi:MAG: aminotransferase class I/II-fold pyridoxal phosphate-dependent enzyme [Candidatus Poseidoniales archaeon]|nr:MAG: aminotransferase class I/II-fold pyridoxal phosphate-dependent enzyme [Candidatus Poseidoniales archaeon]|tara:strand:- start:1106 stop:2302 length:1197 start_codon:yes stop_codon:yes gene_type:complete
MSIIPASSRAMSIEYAIRDVVVPATRLEAEGHEIIKLNIGDPIAYSGLGTPKHMVDAYVSALISGENGYSPSYGLPDLRAAISVDETNKGWDCTSDDVYVTHGVTEALQILFSAVLTEGDRILAPGPHYPPYMAYPQMVGAVTEEYRLDPDNGWKVDIDDIRMRMGNDVRMLVLINPNNPTGAILSPSEVDEIIKIVEEYPHCLIIADEIYDGLVYTSQHVSIASRSSKVPVISMNGVSKVYYAPGWRIGYMALHDPNSSLVEVRDAIERLLRSRLCASTPAQMGYLAGLTGDRTWMQGHRAKVLERRQIALDRIEEINGLSVKPTGGAFYMFVRIDHPDHQDDKQFVLDLLHQEHVLLVHGSGFSPNRGAGHVRIVHLADPDTLNEAFDRIDRFLNS